MELARASRGLGLSRRQVSSEGRNEVRSGSEAMTAKFVRTTKRIWVAVSEVREIRPDRGSGWVIETRDQHSHEIDGEGYEALLSTVLPGSGRALVASFDDDEKTPEGPADALV